MASNKAEKIIFAKLANIHTYYFRIKCEKSAKVVTEATNNLLIFIPSIQVL